MFNYRHLDGRYTYVATAAHNPGDIVTRPDGSLALFDGLQSCAIGDNISPQPLRHAPTADVTKKTSDNMAAAANVYWDSTNKHVTVTAAGNKLMGTVITAAGTGTTSVHINTGGKEVAEPTE